MYQEEKINQRSEAVVASLVVLLVISGTAFLLHSTRVLVGLLVVASLPFWLPYLVVRIRFRIFGLVNGHSGVELPSKKYGAAQYKYVYNHAAASGRSKMNSFGLSDVFWYFLAPAHEIHQEHVENSSPKYKVVANATNKIILRPRAELEAMGRRHMQTLLEEAHQSCEKSGLGMKFVYLRDFFFPTFAKIYYELVFPDDEDGCPDDVCDMIVASTKDVIEALKFCKIRNMTTRDLLTQYLYDRVKAGDCVHIFGESTILSEMEQALYLQGVIFHTGMVQMAEAMAHITLTLAQHKRVQQKLVEEIAEENGDSSNMKYLDFFLQETLRVYPLFGVAHRIAVDDIPVLFDDGTSETIPKGSVLVFSHPAYQRMGFNRPNDFIPERWRTLKEFQCNFIPFGVKNNRPCPGRFASWYWMREMSVLLLQNFDMFTSVEHSRSMPDGGKCVLVSLNAETKRDWYQFAVLTWIWGLHKAQSVWMSLIQFGCGLYMLIDANRQQLCMKHFYGDDYAAKHGEEVGDGVGHDGNLLGNVDEKKSD